MTGVAGTQSAAEAGAGGEEGLSPSLRPLAAGGASLSLPLAPTSRAGGNLKEKPWQRWECSKDEPLSVWGGLHLCPAPTPTCACVPLPALSPLCCPLALSQPLSLPQGCGSGQFVPVVSV